MVLAICIENSNLILCGTSHHRKLFQSYLRTELEGTADEYAISIRSILDLHGLSGSNIEGVILSSVVPPLASVVKQAVKKLTKANILVVGPGIKTGLNLRIENPAQLGADRICNAVAALKKYPAPIMVVDMNTTTTVSVLNEKKMFIGGCIIPGVSSSLEALCTTAAQLPQISIEECPDSIIGSNTVSAMQAGILYGNACLLDGLIQRHQEILGEGLTVVVTGKQAEPIIRLCKYPVTYDPSLLMDGLLILYEKNTK